MIEQLCDFENCKLAREKGFNEPCMYAYINRGVPKEINPIMGEKAFDMVENQFKLAKRDKNAMEALRRRIENHLVINSNRPPHVYARPTQDLLERWLRDEKDYFISIDPVFGSLGIVFVPMVIKWENLVVWKDANSLFITYELAREAAIFHALKLLPNVTT